VDENPKPPKRRWWRFSLRTLLLLMALFAAGVWWITWPSRTVNEFNSLVAQERFDEACAMVEVPRGCRVSIDPTPFEEAQRLSLTPSDSDVTSMGPTVPLRAELPTVTEMLFGTRRVDSWFEVEVVRGRITATTSPSQRR
jgi:hypothetical protein